MYFLLVDLDVTQIFFLSVRPPLLEVNYLMEADRAEGGGEIRWSGVCAFVKGSICIMHTIV
jgi:hypothetical protein